MKKISSLTAFLGDLVVDGSLSPEDAKDIFKSILSNVEKNKTQSAPPVIASRAPAEVVSSNSKSELIHFPNVDHDNSDTLNLRFHKKYYLANKLKCTFTAPKHGKMYKEILTFTGTYIPKNNFKSLRNARGAQKAFAFLEEKIRNKEIVDDVVTIDGHTYPVWRVVGKLEAYASVFSIICINSTSGRECLVDENGVSLVKLHGKRHVSRMTRRAK